jgi:SAM-dependent methyltransferase
VEELTKLLLLRIAAHRHPELRVRGELLVDLIDPTAVRAMSDPQPLKDAFAVVNALPDLGGRIPGGGVQAVWPADEPLRINRCDVLAEALALLDAIPLGVGSTIDGVGTAFDVFLRGKYEHAGGLGTYLTPNAVVRAMSRIGFDLIDPLKGHEGEEPVMGDPCCGSGRFLAGLLEEARARSGVHDTSRLRDSIFGADLSAASVAMARVNLLAYGMSHPEVFTVHDSIVDSALDRLRGRLRLILTNPPFGDGKYDSVEGIARTSGVLPTVTAKRRIDPALAFVARCIDLLQPGGVAGIVLPDGVADGPHLRDLLLGDLRLVDPVRLEGVVSLPSATFAPAGTMAKTSVVFLRKGGEVRRRRAIFLARADHVGFVMRNALVAEDPAGDDLPRIAGAVGSLLAGRPVPKSAADQVLSVQVESLTSVDASSLDRGALAARDVLSGQGGKPFDTVLRVVKKQRVGRQGQVPFVSVLHVDELGNVDWLQASEYSPATPGIVARAGHIIVSLLNPAKFRAAVIPEEFPEVHCSAEFGVYEPIINPYAVLALLQHPSVRAQIAPLGRGTSSSRRRIESQDVLRLIAPPFDDDWVEKTSRQVADALLGVAEARAKLAAAYAWTG